MAWDLCDGGRPWVSMQFISSPLRAGEPVQLGAVGPGRGRTFSWDLDGDGAFDDGVGDSVETTLGVNVSFVGVRSTDDAGRSASETRSVAAAGDTRQAPNVGLFANPTGPGPLLTGPEYLAGRTTQMIAAVRGDVVPDCCSFEWDADGDGSFDDGGGDVHDNLSVLYWPFTAGEHTMAVRVTNADGGSQIATRTVTVGTLLPLASFTISGGTATSTSTDPDGTIARLEWDLDGDRSFDDATGPSATVPAGTHLLGLRVTDTGGDIGISYVEVSEPPPPPPTPSPDRRPPTLSLILPKTRISSLRTHGLALTVSCSEACRTTVTASIDRTTAKRLKLRSRTLGTAAGTHARLRLRLSAPARRAIAHLRSLKLTLAVVAVDAAGNRATKTKQVTLRR